MNPVYDIELRDVGSGHTLDFDMAGGDNPPLDFDVTDRGGGGGGGGTGLPPGGVYGDILTKMSSANYAAMWVTPASKAEEDNTRPITAAAVYTEIGNINALLATI